MKVIGLTCCGCWKQVRMQVNQSDLDAFERGEDHIQDIFPYLTPAEREMFISKTCGECWIRLFPPEEDDE